LPALRPDAILFDLWGTLISADRFDPVRGNAALIALCEGAGPADLARLNERGRSVVTALEGREDHSSLEYTQASLFRLLTESLGLHLRVSLDEAEWAFWDASTDVRLIDGVAEMLAGITTRGIRTAVISNSSFTRTTIERELTRRGIRSFFELVISSADYGIRKPDPIIFEAALSRMGLAAGQAWFAGDHVRYDIEGAHGARLFPVAFNPRSTIPASVGEHAVITRWDQLASLVDQATAALALPAAHDGATIEVKPTGNPQRAPGSGQ
jgi:putative hydrolase of the HAD superfamily